MKKALKGASRSKTIWFNALLLAAMPLLEAAVPLVPELKPLLSPEAYRYVGIFAVIGNIVLRASTKVPLAEK